LTLTQPITVVEGMHCVSVETNGDPPSQLIKRGEEEGESD